MQPKFQISLIKINKKGFTLVEIMVVVILIGIFFSATYLFTDSNQTEKQKSDRIVNLISDIIQGENVSIFLGKMPLHDGKITDDTEITFDKTPGKIGITTIYSGSTGFISSSTVNYPFFDGDEKYELRGLVWTGSPTLSENGSGDVLTIKINKDGMTFSGAGVTRDNNPEIQITAGYGAYESRISIDRRVGKVEVTPYGPQ